MDCVYCGQAPRLQWRKCCASCRHKRRELRSIGVLDALGVVQAPHPEPNVIQLPTPNTLVQIREEWRVGSPVRLLAVGVIERCLRDAQRSRQRLTIDEFWLEVAGVPNTWLTDLGIGTEKGVAA